MRSCAKTSPMKRTYVCLPGAWMGAWSWQFVLERLLAAMFERDNAEPQDKPKWEATVRRLVADAIQKQPGVSHDEFMEAIQPRYHQLRRARKKPPTMPPRA